MHLGCEARADAGNYRPLKCKYSKLIRFHGSLRKHYANANHSPWTHASLDFRVGVEGYFDEWWHMVGTTNNHSRRKVTV